MNVENGLTRLAVAVEHGAITALGKSALSRNRGTTPQHLSNQRLVRFGNVVGCGNVLPRHHEDVHGSLRVDVVECDDVIVLVHQRRGDLATHDLAEQAVHRSIIVDAGQQRRDSTATRGIPWTSHRMVSSSNLGHAATSPVTWSS
jgi:hypothetical protein